MSTLITGASGFVGLNLLELLLGRGERVVGLSSLAVDQRVRSRLDRLPGEFIEVVGDVRNASLLTRIISEQRVMRIAHLAAITADSERERHSAAEILSVNLGGLGSVISAAAAGQVQRFLYASSIAVFGGAASDGSVIDEAATHAPRTLYAITKSAGEAVVARLGALHGMDWVVARLGRVFGPYEYDTGVRDTLSQIYQVTQAALAGRAVVLERPCVKNWNYARDSAANLLTLLNASELRHRVYNLGSQYAWPLSAWCERLMQRGGAFEFAIGAGRGERIDLGGPSDGGLLSWQRFSAEFGSAARFDLDAAFADYLQFLES
jgi:nucleoside-diphosphate-sugar epimerase